MFMRGESLMVKFDVRIANGLIEYCDVRVGIVLNLFKQFPFRDNFEWLYLNNWRLSINTFQFTNKPSKYRTI